MARRQSRRAWAELVYSLHLRQRGSPHHQFTKQDEPAELFRGPPFANHA
jgi:hypothetical protein